MSWRLARSLDALRSQFNRQWPTRNKAADGTVGDAAHRARTSDHNPWIRESGTGIVSALDITHDPKCGLDTYQVAERLRAKKDSRIKYVISNGKIFSSTTSPWVLRRYTGSNPHRSHIHISVKSTKAHYDSTTSWDLGGTLEPPGTAPIEPTRPILRRGSKGDAVTTVQRLLNVARDGDFGPITEAAVKGFQRQAGLTSDGIVGPVTWSEFDSLEQIPVDQIWHRNISVAVAGEQAETDEALVITLPNATADGEMVDVVNPATGKHCTCEMRVGLVPNGAGMAVNPAVARELGLEVGNAVDWAIADVEDEGEAE